MTSRAATRSRGARSYRDERPNGPAFAGVIAAALGTFVLGALTTAAEASKPLKDWLMFVDRVGPLSGKTTIAVTAWALSWLALAVLWRRGDVDLRTVVIVSAVLVGLGVVGTFPTFFEQFAAE